MFTDSGAPGMVLVVVRGQDSVIQAYGETAKGNGQEPNSRSLVRIGSITKTFAGDLLAGLAAEGKVRLTDPLRMYAEGAVVPQLHGREITLLDLATHSAGLPREIGSSVGNSPPFTGRTADERWAWLSNFHLPWEPGSVAAYSNVGFDLLADALSVASGTTYSALLQERITGPLGMKNTTLNPTQEQCSRLMLGSGFGGPGPCVPSEATAGSSGLYSTADDMSLWLKYNMSATPASRPKLTLAQAVYRRRQSMTAAIGFDEAGPMEGLGLAWVTVAAHGALPTIVEKSGGDGGFMSYMAFAPGRDAGIFVVVNRIDFAMFYALAGAANELIGNLVTR
jgi:D-alanyl-D-alanine-carboxypeptidase/D-alanyl-D-alanine-endopeptidase